MDSLIAYWRVLLCALWILISITLSIYLIVKYERRFCFRNEEVVEDHPGMLYEDQVWKTWCRHIHPVFLMDYRILSFFILGCIFYLYLVREGFCLFYYTTWTFALTVVYFSIGSLYSIYGIYRLKREELNEEQVTDQRRPRRVAGFGGYVFQIIYQMLSGALVLVNCHYWFIVVLYNVTKVDMKLDLLGKVSHSVSVVFFLGEVVLNNLRFPWFRIAYFSLWSCFFVVVHWVIHAIFATGWPDRFLILSDSLSPLWYLVIALLHIPCYGVIYLLIKLKYFLLKNFLQDG